MYKCIVTCEHASNHVPEELIATLGRQQLLLTSHRGYDIGAIEVARRIAQIVGAPLFAGQCTRLAIDCNRSSSNPGRFSRYTRSCGTAIMAAIEAQWYTPFKNRVSAWVRENRNDTEGILHLSVHSFTPVLNGVKRSADIGLLYDPSRAGERLYCKNLKQKILQIDPCLRVRYNYPYRGTADGTATWLRKLYSKGYSGLELEINQRFMHSAKQIDGICSSLLPAIAAVTR